MSALRSAGRILTGLAAIGFITLTAIRLVHVNAATVGFAYLLTVLVIASAWGLLEATVASIAATLVYNYNFLPPVGTLTIDDPENWVALFSLLATSLIASRLSTRAKQRALDATARQQDIERLYTFSRSILLTDANEPVPKQIVNHLADVFGLSAALLFERRSGITWRGGSADFEALTAQIHEAAMRGTNYFDGVGHRVITTVRLGTEPIASLAVQGPPMPDSVLQGVANLVAIALERARAQEAANQAEAARQSEQLRTALIDAIAHEFKTPLTSIKAATTAMLAEPEQSAEIRSELLKIADEEADHLRILMDDVIEMGRLDSGEVRIELEAADLQAVVRRVVREMEPDGRRRIQLAQREPVRTMTDERLIALGLRQLLDNALKYSPPSAPISVNITTAGDTVSISITDHGPGIPPEERELIFERFHRGNEARAIPGSGLGLSIAQGVAQAHGGTLTLVSEPGETTFTMSIPARTETARA